MKTSNITQKGQVTIPKELRDAFGWQKDTRVAFIQERDGVKLVAADESVADVLDRMSQTRWKGPSADEVMVLTRSEI